MTLETSTLRPGLLVSLKTAVVGNVSYTKVILGDANTAEVDAEDAEGFEAKGDAYLPVARTSKWETTRLIRDLKENEAAAKVRSKARSLIRSVCAQSAFGMLCPEDKAGQLADAVAEARRLADEFNATAKITRINVFVIAGRIAVDDVEAIRAINSEMRDLMDSMADGIKNLNADQVRDAATRARNVGQMLSAKAQENVKVAIEAARRAARQIVDQANKAAPEIDLISLEAVTKSRTAFLDLDTADQVAAPVEPGRALDLETAHVAAATLATPAPQLDMAKE